MQQLSEISSFSEFLQHLYVNFNEVRQLLFESPLRTKYKQYLNSTFHNNIAVKPS
jgi:hypothetical protein